MPQPSKRKLSHDQLVLVYALLTGLPAIVTVLCILWLGEGWEAKEQWTLTLLIVGFWLGFALALQARVIRPLQTMANLLSALREGDFSVRARGVRRDEPLGDVMFEINTLSRTLQDQRLGALEATALLRTVMEEINIAIFAFDADRKLRLANHAAQLLLAKPAERILGRDAAEIGLADCLDGEPARLLNLSFPGGTGRWGMRRSPFREGGRPHDLVVIADLSRTLREEELQAWQRLVRVLGHELNNSLAPIKSIAGSLESILARENLPDDWRDDMRRGLNVITSRSESLSRFIGAYARLAKLPRPQLQPLDIADCVGRAVSFETRIPVQVEPGAHLTVKGDPDQLELVLINLLRNATDASLTTRGAVHVGWRRDGNMIEIWIKDDGPGLAGTANLFVPFFTTKPGGSGIGLVLSRQIAEGHGGALSLENRADGQGCIACLRLPA